MNVLGRLSSDIIEKNQDGGGIRTKLMEIASRYDNVIALGRGDPDLDTPEHIVAAAEKAMKEGKTHYTHVRGMMELREAISKKLKRDNDLEYNPENEILVTAGAEEAVFLAFLGIINPGDEVIVPAPRYTSYDHAVKMFKGVTVPVECKAENDFAFLPELIREKITPKTKVISLVNPGNPIGLLGPEEVKGIAEIAKEHDLIVISDELYENIIFDGTPHLSVAAIPGMRERTITINGPSKSYAMTGWRCGYMAAPAPFCEMLTEPAHTVTICCSSITQAAALAAYTGPQNCLSEMRDVYDTRRKYMMGVADELNLKYVTPRAGFYLFTDVSSTGLSPDEFCTRFLEEQQVLLFPGKLFADPTNKFIRISLLTPIDRLKEGAERLRKFISTL